LVTFVTLFFCKVFFCYDSLENVAGIDAFKVVFLPAAKQRIFNTMFKICPLFMYLYYQLISDLVKLHDSTGNGCKMTLC